MSMPCAAVLCKAVSFVSCLSAVAGCAVLRCAVPAAHGTPARTPAVPLRRAGCTQQRDVVVAPLLPRARLPHSRALRHRRCSLPLPLCVVATPRLLLPPQTATIPVDTAKVRLQIRGLTQPDAPRQGLFKTVVEIGKGEGPLALFKGLTPGIHRQLLFGSIRLGLYEPVCGVRARVSCSPRV